MSENMTETQPIVVMVLTNGVFRAFQMNPGDFQIEERRNIETIRSATGSVQDLRAVGLPSLQIQGTYLASSFLE